MQNLIPGGVNSPCRAFRGLGVSPLIAESGSGDLICDIDGHAYIDYCGGCGALILGHSHPTIVRAVSNQLKKGSLFWVSTALEKECAGRIISHLPSIESLRFVNSGTEAVMTAIRLARAYTEKPLIVKFDGHYHGHADSLLVQAGSAAFPLASSKGIPQEIISNTVSLPFNELELCRAFLQKSDNLAAVIVEPVAGNMGIIPADLAFLAMLRDETHKKGALLIFDEVITGFRLGLSGAQGHYGIESDLTTLAKVIGGGFTAAAFGGKKEIMQLLSPLGEVFQAGTYSGNPIAMSASLATFDEIEHPTFYQELEAKTAALIDPIADYVHARDLPLTVHRVGSMFALFFGPKKVRGRKDLSALEMPRFSAFFQFLFERGIFISPSPYETSFVSSAHTSAHLDTTRKAILDFLKESYD